MGNGEWRIGIEKAKKGGAGEATIATMAASKGAILPQLKPFQCSIRLRGGCIVLVIMRQHYFQWLCHILDYFTLSRSPNPRTFTQKNSRRHLVAVDGRSRFCLRLRLRLRLGAWPVHDMAVAQRVKNLKK
jgi:hypothetical protein